MMARLILLFGFALLFFVRGQIADGQRAPREFKIDYSNNQFLKDGQPYRFISSSIHYFRMPPEYWRDRLLKLRAASFNAVQTYVAWNVHEPMPGQYRFEAEADIVEYLRLAQELGLDVILRPGPFIDAEWDMGGLPWWLMRTDDGEPQRIALRTSDPIFLRALDRWFGVLFAQLRPLLYANGGPIITVQVENEYGSYYACDRNYTAAVRDMLRKYLGDDAVLFTTDGDGEGFLRCGVVDAVYPTVDFGPTDEKGVKQAFAVQRNHLPNGGPAVNSEYYPGWFDQWGGKHASVDSKSTTDTIRYMWAANASFNVYMFYGGTNYEYWAGAEAGPPFITITTSYDYDAPLSEAGDPTPKYDALRSTILELTQNPNPEPVPPATPKIAYGSVDLEPIGTVFDLLPTVTTGEKWSRYPLTMEQLNVGYGFVLYEMTLSVETRSLTFADVIRDRAHVIIDGRLIKIIDREFSTNVTLDVSGVAVENSKLQILVENRGRICYGSEINDTKGIVGNITDERGQPLIDWKFSLIDLNLLTPSLDRCSSARGGRAIRGCLTNRTTKPRTKQSTADDSFLPTFYSGSLNITSRTTADTFLDARGWSKGQAIVNGRNVGRYWPARGPQMTLFVPAPFLDSPASNRVVLFELDKPGNCTSDGGVCRINFTDQHVLGE